MLLFKLNLILTFYSHLKFPLSHARWQGLILNHVIDQSYDLLWNKYFNVSFGLNCASELD